MPALLHDFRFAVRRLRQTPAFSLTVILTLALGLGATTAIFSLVEGILLRPLPFKDADRLVLLGDHLGNSSGIGVTAVEIATYGKATSAFSSMGATAPAHFELSGDNTFGGEPAEIPAGRLAASVFLTLGRSCLMPAMILSVEALPIFWIVISVDLRPSTRTMFVCGGNPSRTNATSRM